MSDSRALIRIFNVGLSHHKRDARGRLYFERCESKQTDCQARPDHNVMLFRIYPSHMSKMLKLCRHHAEEAASGSEQA